MSPDELLARYKPQLRYDSQEAFFADSAAELTANPGDELRRASGEVLARAGEELSLELLGYPDYASGVTAQPSDMLSIQGKDYRTQYARLREARPDLRNRIYGHAANDSDGRLWLQYWFFYFYNDYHLALDFGLHEGDWEMIEVRTAGDEPDLAVYAQHAYAETREWAEVEKTADGRPVVYPGRGSHASYFEAGLHETEGWWDIVDGDRSTPELELEIVRDAQPVWILWPGFWGDTKASLLAGLEEPSPKGPSQHEQWADPAALLGKAISRPVRAPADPPEVEVRRTGGMLELRFDFSGHPGPRPVKLIATVNSDDESGVPPKTFTFEVEGILHGAFRTRTPLAPEKHYDVMTSVVVREPDGKDVPSAASCTPIEPGLHSAIPEWLKHPLWWLARLLRRR